jgi:hypothetical protein
VQPCSAATRWWAVKPIQPYASPSSALIGRMIVVMGELHQIPMIETHAPVQPDRTTEDAQGQSVTINGTWYKPYQMGRGASGRDVTSMTMPLWSPKRDVTSVYAIVIRSQGTSEGSFAGGGEILR